MASRRLSDLDSRFRPLAERLIADCKSAGIPLVVTFTLRTQAEQDEAVRLGRSKTSHGLHLSQPPEGKSLAIDVCPIALIRKPNYAPADPLWWKVGGIGKALGLRWGGQWGRVKAPPVGKPPRDYLWDPGHFEWKGEGK